MNRYDYLKKKKVPRSSGPLVGEVWVKNGTYIRLRLDKRLVSSHDVVIWDATFNVWGEANPIQVTEKTLLEEYQFYEMISKDGPLR